MADENENDFKFIEAIYLAAENPVSYFKMLEAWDSVIDQILSNAADDTHVEALSRARFHNHFERALRMFESLDDKTQTPEAVVANQPTAAIIADLNGKVAALNLHAKAITNLEVSQRISELPIDADSFQRLDSALKSDFNGTLVIRGIKTNDAAVLVFVIERITLSRSSEPDLAYLLIKTTETTWHETTNRVLTEAFGLTETECNLVEALSRGLGLDEIAQIRQRSILTVRTQVNTILQKTNTHSRSDLLRLITALLHISSRPESPDEPTKRLSANPLKPLKRRDRSPHRAQLPVTQALTLKSKRVLEYADLGTKTGRPVLLIAPTTPPVFPPEFLTGLARHNLRIIAPLKPSFKSLGGRKRSYTIKDRCLDYLELLDHLKIFDFGVAGHCSGGVYACHMATYAPTRIKRVLLVDTGAPMRSVRQFRQMSLGPRRTFVAARVAPWMLKVPHKIVARDFFSGHDKERKVIEYFYHSHPLDIELLKQPDIRSLARNMIAYCLNDVDQLIEDVKVWASDWSSVAEELSENTELRFLHGHENQQFNLQNIRAFSEGRRHVSISVADKAAQLLIYTHPKLFLENLLWAAPN